MLFEPPVGFMDPRLAEGFQVRYWPLCDGRDAPTFATADLHERRCIQFLAAFHRLNVLNAGLFEARQRGAPSTEIRAALENIAAAAAALEKLEDHYAAIGFFAEPSMEGVTYRDVQFVRPEVPKMFPCAASISSHIRVPGLEDLPPEELRGEVTLRQWRYG